MIEEAERAGYLKPNDTIIEPTSGNTGIGLALVCAVRGYKCIIVMPEKMSKEKNDVLNALGATIIRTPTSAAFDAIDSHISEAQRIKERLNAINPGSAHILDQYCNPYNPIAHYDTTAEEIINQLNGKELHLFVATAGTGGTICGIARKLKEKYPKCTIIGVDPKGSLLAQPESLNINEGSGFYEVEGIGYDFIPTVLDRKRVDLWYKSVDYDSFRCSRDLIRREGLLCGGSSGSVTYCALKAIKEQGFNKEGLNCVILLPDSVRNYMTKFLSNEWMITRGFYSVEETEKDPSWFHKHISEMSSLVKPFDYNFIDKNKTIADALNTMKEKNVDCLLSFENGLLKHVVTKKNIMAKLVNNLAKPNSVLTKASLDKFRVLNASDKLRRLQCCLDSEGYAIVLKSDSTATTVENIKETDIFSVINADALLTYITESF
jgi:cystathionine beta-synthase